MISIIIPTYNEQEKLKILLDQITRINDNVKKEIIIIDSSSTDNTAKIAKKYTKKVFIIPKAKFNHGQTRNQAVYLTSNHSKYIFFTTQDTQITSKDFFVNHLLSFKKNPKAVVSFGPHIPHPNTPLFESSEIHCLFKRINNYYQKPTNIECWEKYFISHNNAMYKKSFIKQHPLNQTDFAEDLQMGVYLQKNNFEKVFTPNSPVYHSHSYSLIQYIKRERKDIQQRKLILKIPPKNQFLCKIKYIWKNNTHIIDKIIQTYRGIIRYILKFIFTIS